MSKWGNMRELYDPVYYPPNIQGFDDPYQQHQQYRHPHPPPPQQQQLRRVTSSSKSSSSSSPTSVLGRFLKLGKSKSDASLGSNNGGGIYGLSTGIFGNSSSSSSTLGGGGGGRSSSSRSNYGNDELDEFRLSPSVIARGPVEKMVHKANSRKDVSRSHSWIYGSVKLPSDLPFGYGDQFSFQGEGNGADADEVGVGESHQHQPSAASSSGHYLHTHGLQAMQIPRCQLDYYCTCDCGGGVSDDRGGMMSPSGRHIAGGSVRAGGLNPRKPPCQGCAREMAMSGYALPSSGKRKSGGTGGEGESFVSSVRKLTWKSLKQVVKKRPSLDTLKRMPAASQQQTPIEYLSAPIVPLPYLSPSAVAAASATSPSPGMMIAAPLSPTVNANPMANLSHYGGANPPHHNQRLSHNGAVPNHPQVEQNGGMSPEESHQQPNYFFPEKKGFYASCNDIYGGEPPPPNVTASVRVRPKRTRQPWQFDSAAQSSEFGPVPNYEEEQDQAQLYHSEWDLRHVMSYDVWMNTTSNVKPRPEAGPGPSSGGSVSSKSSRSQSAERHSVSSGNLHHPAPDYAPTEPTTFRPQSQKNPLQQSRSNPNLHKLASSKSSQNGSVKMAKSASSQKSLTSLHSPSVGSVVSTSSKKSSTKNSSQSGGSDTLSISSFGGTPSNPNKPKESKTGIVKRSSILAADVTAYQLLKAQTKKGKSVGSSNPSEGVQSPPQPILKTSAKTAPIKQHQPQPDLEDAFSESSDDLSDNAITSSSDHANRATPTSSNGNGGGEKSRVGVRIAGQGIRMVPNRNNQLKTNPKSMTVMTPSIVVGNGSKAPQNNRMTSSSSSSTTFTNYQQSAQQSNNRSQQRSSAPGITIVSTSKSGSKVVRQNSSGSSEDELWSDCHAVPERTRMRKALGLAVVEHHVPPPGGIGGGGGSRDRGVELTTSSSSKSASVSASSSSSSTVMSLKVNSSANNNQSHRVGGSGGGGSTRPTLVTFEGKPQQQPKKTQKFRQDEMEFEEYEFDENGPEGNSSSGATTQSSSNLKSLGDNVVSLNVTRGPVNLSKCNDILSNSPNQHPTYIKHTKGQQASSNMGKFGALRRRKSRSGSNGTSPGKLLQETIYEEESEHIDDFNNFPSTVPSSSPSKTTKVAEHSVKIMVSQGTGSNPSGVVKPILKNRERTYETPVPGNQNPGCTDNPSQKLSFDSASPSTAYNDPSSGGGTDQIYFDSSMSTVSTASKKKVQFDQRPEVVVCGGDSSSGQESYDEENDDSDQWSNKSEDEELDQRTQYDNKPTPSGNNDNHHQVITTPVPTMNASCQPPQSDKKPQQDEEKRARTTFEEEVARKAAAFAKSRRETEEGKQREAEAKAKEVAEKNKKNESRNDEDDGSVNNLQRQLQQQSHRILKAQNQPVPQPAASMNENSTKRGRCANPPRNGEPITNPNNKNSNKPTTTTSQGSMPTRNRNNSADNNGLNGFAAPANSNKNHAKNSTTSSTTTVALPAAVNLQRGGYSKNGSKPAMFEGKNETGSEIGSPSNRILNPNSLLFHDTTRIRLNQSRPALHESTFKLPNSNGLSPSPVKRGMNRLKQSNSFRSVSTLTLRPREPPPPPPTFQQVTSGSRSVSARLQKALSTSTLLSKSTEKLNNLAPSLSISSKSINGSASSHYGPGGKLLPTKAQISLPLGFTTTSKTAGLLASSPSSTGSVDKLNLAPSSKDGRKPPSKNFASGGVRGRLNKSTTCLATRSKSLTDRCEALEKVLGEQRRNEFSDELRRSTPSLNTFLPKDDMDSKSIEIVTKENSVSEIRIYSASTSALQIHPAENLPYQGIIYESTKTIITAGPESPPETNSSSVPKSSEIHYAATDLFPPTAASPPPPPAREQVQQNLQQNKTRQSPFSHPPLPPLPAPTSAKDNRAVVSESSPGKSVVLIIDNSNKSKLKPSTPPAKKEESLPAYSQPVDTISSSTPPATVTSRCALPPQIPLPSIPTDLNENDLNEPLYDDVINHSVDIAPSLPPTKLNGGTSLGRKSLPPHQLGELPPLPPPPVPPHRTPIIPPTSVSTSPPTSVGGQVVSSTLPCLACPPTLPPPNLPSKSLSEFHNRPLIIQESDQDDMTSSTVIHHHHSHQAFPTVDVEEEVDNLYNDIASPTTPTATSLPGHPHTIKSSTAAFASAMKEAFLGAISHKSSNNKDSFDRRSIHSTGSNGTTSSTSTGGKQGGGELIYDDTLSVISSPIQKTSALMNHLNNQNTQQHLMSLPLPPPTNNKNPENVLGGNEDDSSEPLYDDVLNLTATEDKVKDENKMNGDHRQGSGSEYHSSNTSDSGTEDLPPPLPTQGPPPLPKGGVDLPLLSFPLLNAIPISNSSGVAPKPQSLSSSSPAPPSLGKKVDGAGAKKAGDGDRTRNLLTELNEKLSKLNGFPATGANNPASSSPGSSSLSSAGTSSGAGEGQDNSGDFSSYHISKVVISPSSESSGVEEDYNSEKNYSLSNGSDAASSGGGSDNEIPSTNNPPLGPKPASETISLARGKFLENMKLSMLSSMGAGGAVAPAPSPHQGGLLMMTTNNSKNAPLPEDDEDEPIYEEIGEKANPTSTKRVPSEEPEQHEDVDLLEEDENDDNRSASPVYADAFDAKSMFDGASRSEILSFLESIRDRLTGAESTASSESQSSSISRSSTVTGSSSTTLRKSATVNSVAEDDETGSGVEEHNEAGGNIQDIPGETPSLPSSPSLLLLRRRLLICPDCNDDIPLDDHQEEEQLLDGDPTVTTGVAHPSALDDNISGGRGLGSSSSGGVCRSCHRKRNEKKEIIMEIYETELKYGRDLRIISDEFYKPIQVAGLLAKEQLDQIFLNVDHLIQINLELTSRLKSAIQQSTLSAAASLSPQPEESLGEVNVGKIFLELGETMMTAFENYCTRQASAGALLSQLEKEKELLRIFLRVSQMENTVLRRMNLPAFLMVPVQRVTRYPLLLSRLLKVTPVDHFTRDELQSAHEKIEQHLEHMNKTTREVASVKLWRRISIINGNSSSSNNSSGNGGGPAHRRSNSDLDTSNIRIRKMAMDVLDWTNFSDVTCVMDNQLGSVHINGKMLRNIYGCLLARGKDLEGLLTKIQDQDPFFPPAEDVVKDVKLVLVRVKNTRFCLLREPLCLSKCVVSQGENEFQDFIEINEITTKNTYFIQGLDKQGTLTWLKFLQSYSSCVGHWRRRRPALANIMMNGMIKHL